MQPTRLKIGYFVLEGLNSLASTFFLYYLFFLMRDEHGFLSRGNLYVTALHGFTYMIASWQGGRFAQKFGYFKALRFGYCGMAAALACGLLARSLAGQLVALVAWTVPLCLIWPALEALVTEGQDLQGTARMVGVYNVVWAASNAVAYCAGGWLWEKLGRLGLFGLPLGLMILQLIIAPRLEALASRTPPAAAPRPAPSPRPPEPAAFGRSAPPRLFLQMAWLANPFAYVAINTIVAVVPQLANRFHLTPAQSGLFCSLWFYARLGAFVLLWQWTGWHYRFRWLFLSFAALFVSFGALLMAPEFWMVIAAQVVFGLAVGLVYYSSLFYSMDVGQTKSEHGGLHEAAIGLGIFAGPALGATALTFLPEHPNSGALAVSLLLLCGLAGLVILRLRKPRHLPPCAVPADRRS